jgi:hypothetical protein
LELVAARTPPPNEKLSSNDAPKTPVLKRLAAKPPVDCETVPASPLSLPNAVTKDPNVVLPPETPFAPLVFAVVIAAPPAPPAPIETETVEESSEAIKVRET